MVDRCVGSCRLGVLIIYSKVMNAYVAYQGSLIGVGSIAVANGFME